MTPETLARLADYWNPRHVSLPFGEWGNGYTIVPERHIGMDQAKGGDIPCLIAGTVHAVVRTETMAWVVVIDTGLPGARRFHSYCHMANDRLPRVGARIEQGQRVARPARGSRDTASPEWGGRLWNGLHTHFVIGGHSASAYSFVNGHRTLSAFTNPADVVRDVLAQPASGGGAPNPNPGRPGARRAEDDDMPIPIRLNLPNGRKHHFIVTPMIGISHCDNEKSLELAMKIVSAEDQWVDLDSTKFNEQLDNFGIPTNVVRHGDGWVFDPSAPDGKGGKGAFRSGGVWTWTRHAHKV